MTNMMVSMRKDLNKLVRAKGYSIAFVTGLPVSKAIEMAWNILYDAYTEAYDIEIRYEAASEDMSIIAYAEKHGLIVNLLILAGALFTNLDARVILNEEEKEF